MRLTVLLLILIAFGVPASAKQMPAHAKLIADVSAVQPGQKFHVAVEMTMDPGWHIYWINPGDAGQATKITFHAPDGFKVTPGPFPYPSALVQPGDITVYGYENKALFIADVTAPADLKPDTPLQFSADVRWLVCKELCLPGKDQPKLDLNTGTSSPSDNATEISDALTAIPSLAADRATVQTTHNAARYTITLNWHEPARNIAVFTAPGDPWQLQDAKLSGDERSTTYSFTVHRLDPSAKLPMTFPIVLVYDNPAGQRKSVLANITVDQTN